MDNISLLDLRDLNDFSLLDLHDSIFATYKKFEKFHEGGNGVGARSREAILGIIGGWIDGYQVNALNTAHLETLEMLIRYWRECEVVADCPQPEQQWVCLCD
jgi:hypothetical protein